MRQLSIKELDIVSGGEKADANKTDRAKLAGIDDSGSGDSSQTSWQIMGHLASNLCSGPTPQQLSCKLAVQAAFETAPQVLGPLANWGNQQFTNFVVALDQAFTDINNGSLSGPMPQND